MNQKPIFTYTVKTVSKLTSTTIKGNDKPICLQQKMIFLQ